MKNHFESEKLNTTDDTVIESEEQTRETLPAITVDNKVIWVNSEIESPFNIENDKPTELGIFFTPDPKGEKTMNMEVMKQHNRSGILGKVIFKDKQGRLYRDVDLKGIGHVDVADDSEKMTVRPLEILEDENEQTRGIAGRGYVQRDKKMTEKFLNENIRTYRIIAITKLEEIIDKSGNKVSIADAKKAHIIKSDDEPVVEIRAFGTRTRIGDLVETNQQERDSHIEDAMRLVARERGVNYDNFSRQDYFNWFIETMAVNLARMHHNGLVHGYLSDHNITLDARVVDLDSVETIDEVDESSIKSFDNDMASLEVMSSFLKGILGLGKEILRPDVSIDDSDSLYVDEDTKEKIWEIYNEERKKLEEGNLKM